MTNLSESGKSQRNALATCLQWSVFKMNEFVFSVNLSTNNKHFSSELLDPETFLLF